MGILTPDELADMSPNRPVNFKQAVNKLIDPEEIYDETFTEELLGELAEQMGFHMESITLTPLRFKETTLTSEK